MKRYRSSGGIMEPIQGSQNPISRQPSKKKQDKTDIQKKTETAKAVVRFNEKVDHRKEFKSIDGERVVKDEKIKLIDENIALGLTKAEIKKLELRNKSSSFLPLEKLTEKEKKTLEHYENLQSLTGGEVRNSELYKKNKIAKNVRKAESRRKLALGETVEPSRGFRRKEANSAKTLTNRSTSAINEDSPAWKAEDLEQSLKHLMKISEQVIKDAGKSVQNLDELLPIMIKLRDKETYQIDTTDVAAFFLEHKYATPAVNTPAPKDEDFLPKIILKALTSANSLQDTTLESKREILASFLDGLKNSSDPIDAQLLGNFLLGLRAKNWNIQVVNGSFLVKYDKVNPSDIEAFLVKQNKQLEAIKTSIEKEKLSIKKEGLTKLHLLAIEELKKEGKTKFTWAAVKDRMIELYQNRTIKLVKGVDILNYINDIAEEKAHHTDMLRKAAMKVIIAENQKFSWDVLYNLMNELLQRKNEKLEINFDILSSEDVEEYIIRKSKDGALALLAKVAQESIENKKGKGEATWEDIENLMIHLLEQQSISLNIFNNNQLTKEEVNQYVLNKLQYNDQ